VVVLTVQCADSLQARPDLIIQDITALCVSLINLSLSCYPDRLEYVDQILSFAQGKVQEFQQRYVRVMLVHCIALSLPVTYQEAAISKLALSHNV
jgi:hypothetical protein